MRFRRIDHIVLQVPGIETAHARLLALGFATAWPVGRNWPYGPTSGIALGGINLELLQPDESPPGAPALAEIVFAPIAGVPMETYGETRVKIESDPERLAARGFPAAMLGGPQRICTNAFPGPESPWPHFVCDYAPVLADLLARADVLAPLGPVERVEVGPLAARSRFSVPPTVPDLDRFLAETTTETGPRLCAGANAVVFRSGARLRLRDLTIEA